GRNANGARVDDGVGDREETRRDRRIGFDELGELAQIGVGIVGEANGLSGDVGQNRKRGASTVELAPEARFDGGRIDLFDGALTGLDVGRRWHRYLPPLAGRLAAGPETPDSVRETTGGAGSAISTRLRPLDLAE